jgi:TM2 domain-containing membrane protein YozV
MNEDVYRAEPPTVTLGPNKKHCFACANILDVRAELCPKCGVRQPSMAPVIAPMPLLPVPISSKSRMTAGLFAFFLGGIGVHKFYLGQTAAGVLYILFCWTLIPALIAFVESLMLFGMSDQDFARKFP